MKEGTETNPSYREILSDKAKHATPLSTKEEPNGCLDHDAGEKTASITQGQIICWQLNSRVLYWKKRQIINRCYTRRLSRVLRDQNFGSITSGDNWEEESILHRKFEWETLLREGLMLTGAGIWGVQSHCRKIVTFILPHIWGENIGSQSTILGSTSSGILPRQANHGQCGSIVRETKISRFRKMINYLWNVSSTNLLDLKLTHSEG